MNHHFKTLKKMDTNSYDLVDCIRQLALGLDKVKALTGQAKKNARAHIRQQTRKVVNIVGTHKESCGVENCVCKRLEKYCTAEVLLRVPDLTNNKTVQRKLVMYPAQHDKACSLTWDRNNPPYYCALACEDRHVDWEVRTCESETVVPQTATGGSKDSTMHTNDCGCEKAGAKIFRKATELDFTHHESQEKCLEDVIQHLMLQCGRKRKRTT